MRPGLGVFQPAAVKHAQPAAHDADADARAAEAALAPLTALLDAVTQRLDLCDPPKLLDLSSLDTLKTALTAAGPAIAALQAPIASLAGIINPLASLNLVQLLLGSVNAVLTLPSAVTGLTTAVTSLNSVLNSVKGTATNGQTQIKNTAESMTAAINTLLSAPNTTHNTKRLTVAIWLDTNINAGLRQPVWASTVVSDRGRPAVSVRRDDGFVLPGAMALMALLLVRAVIGGAGSLVLYQRLRHTECTAKPTTAAVDSGCPGADTPAI